MKTYRVIASYVTYCTAEIEAEDKDEAWAIAKNMDGGDFDPNEINCDNWEIEEIQEVQVCSECEMPYCECDEYEEASNG